MDVADNIERTMVVAAIVVQTSSLDLDRFDIIEAIENEDLAETFVAQGAKRGTKLCHLADDHVAAEVAVGAIFVALDTNRLRRV